MIAAPHESTFYHKLSNAYEAVFARFFVPAVRYTIPHLKIPAGSKVLELGVGTGLSLDFYPHDIDVTGGDLSSEMLKHAQEKIDTNGYRHIRVQQMDALNLDFADDTFDYVMAFHLVTVVPDSSRLLQEMVRVCKPNGTVVVINHFRSPRRWLAKSIDLLNPLTHLMGWRTTLDFEDLVSAAPIKVLRRFKLKPQSLFTVMIGEKLAAPVAEQAAAS